MKCKVRSVDDSSRTLRETLKKNLTEPPFSGARVSAAVINATVLLPRVRLQRLHSHARVRFLRKPAPGGARLDGFLPTGVSYPDPRRLGAPVSD